MNNEKRLRDMLFSLMLEMDRPHYVQTMPSDLDNWRARISNVLKDTAPVRTPLGARQRQIEHENSERTKLVPTGDAQRDRLVAARLHVHSDSRQ